MPLPSRLDAVTVFRSGAVCTRLALVEPGQGPVVRVGGLPMSARPGSLRARPQDAASSVLVLDVRPDVEATLQSPQAQPVEATALAQAREALGALRLRLESVQRDLDQCLATQPRFPAVKPGQPPRPAPLDSMLALSDFLDGRLQEGLALRRTLRAEVDEAQARVTLLERRMEESSSSLRGEHATLHRVATVTLSQAPTAPLVLAVEYEVPGARWTPSYQLSLSSGLTGGRLVLRAHVAQRTREDWLGVALSLSTADLHRRMDAPELKSLRIGRAQATPAPSGWRPPPAGLEELFSAYDAALASAPVPAIPRPSQRPQPRSTAPVREASDRKRKKRGGGAPPPPAPLLERAVTAAPMMAMAASVDKAEAMAETAAFAQDDFAPRRAAVAGRRRQVEEEDLFLDDMALGGPPDEAPETPSAALLDYASLSLASLSAGPGARGRLALSAAATVGVQVHVGVLVEVVAEVVAQAQDEAEDVAALPLPPGCAPVGPVDFFDHRHDCAARCDVPSTGGWVGVSVGTCEVRLEPAYVCVPSVQSTVYRTMQVANLSGAALLPGPVDVSVGDAFLLTSSLPALPPQGSGARLGLGAEEAIKVARQTHFREAPAGFLGGSTGLHHEVEVALDNRLATVATVEVRERVPLPAAEEKDVKVEEGPLSPAWEKVEGPVDGAVVAGLRRWRVTLQPGQKQTLRGGYVVRIPADKVLHGGNRRD